MLAVVRFPPVLEAWRHCVQGARVRLHTDHRSLKSALDTVVRMETQPSAVHAVAPSHGGVHHRQHCYISSQPIAIWVRIPRGGKGQQLTPDVNTIAWCPVAMRI